MTDLWTVVRGRLPFEAEDAVAELIAELGGAGASVEPRADGTVEVAVYVAANGAAPALRTRLAALGAHAVRVETLPDRDWMASYRDSARAFAVGRRWWVDPLPEAPSPAPDGRLRLVVEPRTAFGSGSHESTRLVLEELEDRPPTGRSVLDVGTGSGILALAAERLGAATVVGFDLDPEALWVARQTVALQEWRSRVLLFAGPLGAIGDGARFDRIVCNMISEQFLPLVEALVAMVHDGGEIVFSGLLEPEPEALAGRLREAGLEVRSVRHEAGWAAVRTTRA